MSFATKENLVGLTIEGLTLRSNGQNASNGVLQIHGANGSWIGEEIFGHIKNPTCEYAITKKLSLSGIKLGNCYNKPYALSRIAISTGAGQEPTFNADAVQIEAGATQSLCTYTLSTIDISPARHALTFGAFTYTESAALTLQNSDYEASVNLSPTTINGDPVASDSVEGQETVNVTMWSSSETEAPTVTINTEDGWKQLNDWTCVGADSSMFTWTATFYHPLTAVEKTN